MALLFTRKVRVLLTLAGGLGMTMVPTTGEGGASGSLMLMGRVTSHQSTHVVPSSLPFSTLLATSPGGTELARITHQTNSGEGFLMLISDTSGGTLSLGGKAVPYSVEVERAHPVRPALGGRRLLIEPGTRQPAQYSYSLRLRLLDASRPESRRVAPPETLILSIVAL